MPTQEELDIQNKNSVSKQRASRARREAEKAVQDRRDEMLRNATTNKERRNIKAGIYDISTTRSDENKQGTETRIQNDGIDRIEGFDGNDGGDSDGFDLVTFNVVMPDNTVAQYQWRAEEVT